MSTFWDTIKNQLEQLKSARTADEVVTILNTSNAASAELCEYLGNPCTLDAGNRRVTSKCV